MLCEECKIREATISMVVRRGNESATRHLCAGCMMEMNRKMTGGSLMDLLSGILTSVSERESAKDTEGPENDLVCGQCGTTLRGFLKSGRLGCAQCYHTFEEQLQPMLLRIHGRVRHAGRVPAQGGEEGRKRSRREELSRLMAQAVAVEDFETAAQLRDELRRLTAKEGQT